LRKKQPSTMKNKKQLQLLKYYENIFTKPQYNHFSTFIKCLQVCEKFSVSRFSELSNKSVSSLGRFLSKSAWKLEDLSKKYISQISNYINDESYLLIDDTISHRPYSKKVESANYHYDHTNNKQSLGYCIVTSTILTDDYQIPYQIKPYYRKKDCIDFKFITKNEITRDFILSTKNQSKIDFILFDSWFSNKTVIGACKEANKHYITQVKSNRKVTIDKKERFVREHAKEIKENDWDIFTYQDYIIRIFSTSAFISKIGSVHLIFSQIFDEKKMEWSDTNYIISDVQSISSPEIIAMYLNRVGIESFHREAKQNTGLEGYFLRKRRGIEKYLFLTMIAYAHLVLLSIEMEELRTIGNVCEERKKEVFMDAFDEIQRNPELKEVICMKLAKARV
jgi:uncharacterized protein YbgA (DUF1722 family)